MSEEKEPKHRLRPCSPIDEGEPWAWFAKPVLWKIRRARVRSLNACQSVYWVLVELASDEESSVIRNANVNQIAYRAGLSVRATQYALNDLHDLGIIVIVRRRRKGTRESDLNEYKLISFRKGRKRGASHAPGGAQKRALHLHPCRNTPTPDGSGVSGCHSNHSGGSKVSSEEDASLSSASPQSAAEEASVRKYLTGAQAKVCRDIYQPFTTVAERLDVVNAVKELIADRVRDGIEADRVTAAVHALIGVKARESTKYIGGVHLHWDRDTQAIELWDGNEFQPTEWRSDVNMFVGSD